MPDYKKFDEIDMVVIDEPWTPEERKAFSEYLKAQKAKRERNGKSRSIPSAHTKPKAKAKH